MKNYLYAAAIACSIATVSLAYAQQQQEREFEIKVNNKDIELIGKALGKLPFEEVAPLFQKLQVQIQQQNMPKPPVEPKKE